MDTASSAKLWLLPRMPLRVRLLPAEVQGDLIDAWVLWHGRVGGDTAKLTRKMREYISARQRTGDLKVGGLETILLQMLLSFAIQWIAGKLQEWWDGRHQP